MIALATDVHFMRCMSFELSFLRQSYICAPALSAGQVDGIKFHSGPFPRDRNFLLFPPQIPRGYISRCEQNVANHPVPAKTLDSTVMISNQLSASHTNTYKGAEQRDQLYNCDSIPFIVHPCRLY